MFITKMSLPRRTFLRGMGVTLALPLLESMVPALTATAATAANPQRRFGAIFVPLGERPGYWTPKTVGENFELNTILQPLEPFRDHLTVVSELCNPIDGHATTRGSVAERLDPETDHCRERPYRRHDRPGHRKADRTRHGVPVARAGDRRFHRIYRGL